MGSEGCVVGMILYIVVAIGIDLWLLVSSLCPVNVLQALTIASYNPESG